MNAKYLVIMVLMFIQSVSYGQIVDYKLKDLNQQEAEEWALKLDLSEIQENRMADILFEHDINLRNSAKKPRKYKDLLAKLENDKAIKLKKVLGDHNYNTYRILSEADKNDLYVNMREIVGSYSKNDSFVKEMLEIQRKKYLFLSNHFIEFSANMSVKDYRELENIKEHIFVHMDSTKMNQILLNGVDAESRIDTEKHFKRIISLLDKYSDDYGRMRSEIAPTLEFFDNEIDDLYLSYFPESNLKTVKEMDLIYNKSGFSSSMEKLQFVLIDPYNKDRMMLGLMFSQSAKQKILDMLK